MNDQNLLIDSDLEVLKLEREVEKISLEINVLKKNKVEHWTLYFGLVPSLIGFLSILIIFFSGILTKQAQLNATTDIKNKNDDSLVKMNIIDFENTFSSLKKTVSYKQKVSDSLIKKLKDLKDDLTLLKTQRNNLASNNQNDSKRNNELLFELSDKQKKYDSVFNMKQKISSLKMKINNFQDLQNNRFALNENSSNQTKYLDFYYREINALKYEMENHQ